jgi:hypothetical protein
MRVVCVLLASGILASAQSWKNELMQIPEHPTAQNFGDVDRFVQNVQMATPYFATITPGDFEANREVVRRMWAYTMALEIIAKQNPMMRPMANRARRAMNAFPIGYNMMMVQPAGGAHAQAPAEPSPAKPGEAPFVMSAPAGVPGELAERYSGSAARAATVWKNAEKMRLDLQARGMSLNATTSAAVGRLQGDMDSAVRNMSSKNWAEANAALDRADAEMEKISKVVGH